MLNPELNHPNRIEVLRAAWNEHKFVRISGLFDVDSLHAIGTAIQNQSFTLCGSDPDALVRSDVIQYQNFQRVLRPNESEEPVLNQLVDWVNHSLASWVGGLVDRALQGDPAGQVLCTLYSRGGYLDPHNDWDGSRSVAYVIGLTPPPWEPKDGGCLEMMSRQGEMLAQYPPGWNTLDLFDVTGAGYMHQVSMVRSERLRWAIPGWFFPQGNL
jgi:hypothetical protein